MIRNPFGPFQRIPLSCLVFLISILGILLTRAEILDHRVRVSLTTTSRPATGIRRDREIFYDQKAWLTVKVMNPLEATLNLQARWVLLYDDVTSSGRIKPGNLCGESPLTVPKGTEARLDTPSLRLSGKVTRNGQPIGLNYAGYGIQLFENGNIAYEKYEPRDLKANAQAILAARNLPETNGPPSAASTGPSRNESTDPRPSPAPSSRADATPVFFELTFSAEETQRILKTVNEFSYEDLCRRVGLGKNAAQQIATRRPVATLADLAQIPYVKKQAFTLLKAYVNRK